MEKNQSYTFSKVSHERGSHVSMEKISRDKIPNCLAHSQHCERNIKLTSKTVLKAQGHDNQKSKIIVSQESSEKFPSKSTKTDVIKTLQL